MSTQLLTNLYRPDCPDSAVHEPDADQVLLSAQPTEGRPCFLFTQKRPTSGWTSTRSWRIALAPSTLPGYPLTPTIKNKLNDMARNSGQGTSHIEQAIYNAPTDSRQGEPSLAKCLWEATCEAVQTKGGRPDKETILARLRANDEVLRRKACNDTLDTVDDQNEATPADPSVQVSTPVDTTQEDLSNLPAVVLLDEDVFNKVTSTESLLSGMAFDYAARALEYYHGLSEPPSDL